MTAFSDIAFVDFDIQLDEEKFYLADVQIVEYRAEGGLRCLEDFARDLAGAAGAHGHRDGSFHVG